MFLDALIEDDLAWLGTIGDRAEYQPGAVLIADGAQASDLFILLSGHAAVLGAGAVLAHLRPGDVAGEISLIDGLPASATVMLTAPGQVMRVQRQPLLARLESGDGFAFRFHRAVAMILAGRLRGSNQRQVIGSDARRALSQLMAA
ncbi:cyclic nucleotide-binding domain-containing protein [Elstera litoralis]|uniref:cyclic nucleotide-binding domain-containing protein n=1 Tax=Elstera litoralis TaxID=552518 RepID=UPI000696E373|nr:cyclic nucleotide-binding domain-containing protein [Elstera litoralis]